MLNTNVEQIISIYTEQIKLTQVSRKNLGLYRDDGLAAINSSSGPVLDKMRKNIMALFKNEGLSITIETNLFETDFLDVTFNLATGKFFPSRKSN